VKQLIYYKLKKKKCNWATTEHYDNYYYDQSSDVEIDVIRKSVPQTFLVFLVCLSISVNQTPTIPNSMKLRGS